MPLIVLFGGGGIC